jgi:hypothetical protein
MCSNRQPPLGTRDRKRVAKVEGDLGDPCKADTLGHRWRETYIAFWVQRTVHRHYRKQGSVAQVSCWRVLITPVV